MCVHACVCVYLCLCVCACLLSVRVCVFVEWGVCVFVYVRERGGYEST